MARKAKTNERYSPTLDRIAARSKKEVRTVSWQEVDSNVVHELIVAVTDAGGGVLFGATRDRGAWAITVFHEELPAKKQTDYCNSPEMLEDFVRGLAEVWADIAKELGAETG